MIDAVDTAPGTLSGQAKHRKAPRKKTIPPNVSLRGLSAADLVIVLAYHGPMPRQRYFYRNQLLLERWNDCRDYEVIRRWWSGLAERTREWIAPGSPAVLSDGLIACALVRARKQSALDWVLCPDADDLAGWRLPEETERGVFQLLQAGELSKERIADRLGIGATTVYRLARFYKQQVGQHGTRFRKPVVPPRPRRLSCWYRNRLWLNWYETMGSPLWRNPSAIARQYAGLPHAAKELLEGDGKKHATRLGANSFNEPTPKAVTQAVRSARRKRDGSANGPDPKERRSRRWRWLELRNDGHTCSTIRRSEKGVRQDWHGTNYVQHEVYRARWEREIRGKPPLYGLGLWALKHRRGGLTYSAIVARWNDLTFSWRKHLCPGRPGELPHGGKGAGTVQYAIRMAIENGAESFLAQQKPKGYGFPPASNTRGAKATAANGEAAGERLGNGTAAAIDAPLAERPRCILQALLELDAIDHDRRCTIGKVSEQAFGRELDPHGLRTPLRVLRESQLTASCRGQAGGIWLTAAGVNRARALFGSPSAGAQVLTR